MFDNQIEELPVDYAPLANERRSAFRKSTGDVNDPTSFRKHTLIKTSTLKKEKDSSLIEIRPDYIHKRSKSSSFYGDKFQLQKCKIKKEIQRTKKKKVIQT